MATLQINEPGVFATKIDLAGRWGPDHTVVIGVARGDMGPNHISFRKPTGFISRRQTTVMALNGNENKLVVRDGGKEPDGQWSQESKQTYLDGRKLSHNEWVAFPVGAILRFHPEKPSTAGYSVHLVWDDTDNTHGLDTVRLDSVRAWSAISQTSRGTGTMLLSAPGNDGVAIIIRLDSNAERLLGAESGELKEVQENCLLNNLLPAGKKKEQLGEHIEDAIIYPGQATYGFYDFGAGPVKLRLENRLINNQYALLGWLSPEQIGPKAKPDSGEMVSKGSWQSEAAKGAIKWAREHPKLAAFIVTVVAIAVVVIKLMGN
ncbi:MAG: hypothetical protein AAGF93_00510 [Cyanobacteria bacterium P01_H01_bin.105]